MPSRHHTETSRSPSGQGIDVLGQTPQNSNGMLAGAHNLVITGGTFVTKQSGNVDESWMELLRSQTTPGAFHDSDDRRDAPKCHPHTREAVLKDLMDWVIDPDPKEQFCWIYGPAGSGKSSIAQTIAELCKMEGWLASDFFFARTVPGRNTYAHLIPTLAYQLALSIPELRLYMSEVISSDKLIFTRSLRAQLDNVILKPLSALINNNTVSDEGFTGRSCPHVIIIDGLDECNGQENQKHILSSFSEALRATPVPFILLITSRPEHEIRTAFNGDLHKLTRRIVLDTKYNPDKDIRTYLNSEFGQIKHCHPLALTIPAEWPDIAAINHIVRKASGQFIYASTVVKFVKDHQDNPTRRLDIVLKLRPAGNHTPFAELDALYGHILSSLERSVLGPVFSIFAFLFMTASHYDASNSFAKMAQTPEFIEAFLGLETGDIFLVLADLHSIVDVPSPRLTDRYPPLPERRLRLFHASLGDFLLDKGRSGRFYIDMDAYNTKFAIRCIEHLTPSLVQLVAKSIYFQSPVFLFSNHALPLILTSINTVNEDLFHQLSQFRMDLYFRLKFWRDTYSLDVFTTLFHWATSKRNDLYEMFSKQYANAIKSWLRSNVKDAFQQGVMTGLALAVIMALETSNQNRQIVTIITLTTKESSSSTTADLYPKAELSKTFLPLSHFTPLSSVCYSVGDGPIDSAAEVLQERLFHFVEVIEKLSPKDQWPHFVGRFFTGRARMNHYLHTAHILTHNDDLRTACTGTESDEDATYLVDACKLSDFAIRLFDLLTADEQDSLGITQRRNSTNRSILGEPSVAITILELFCFALPLIPGQPKLLEHLTYNRHMRMNSFFLGRVWQTKFESCITHYIEQCTQYHWSSLNLTNLSDSKPDHSRFAGSKDACHPDAECVGLPDTVNLSAVRSPSPPVPPTPGPLLIPITNDKHLQPINPHCSKSLLRRWHWPIWPKQRR